MTRFVFYLVIAILRTTFTEALAWPYLMAASTMIVAPVVITFSLTQRTFIEGVTLTGMKG